MILSLVQQLLSETVPNARITMMSSGCAEIDFVCRPLNITVGGPSSEAEKKTDYLQNAVQELGLSAKRIGPREIAVKGTYKPTLYNSDDTVSF